MLGSPQSARASRFAACDGTRRQVGVPPLRCSPIAPDTERSRPQSSARYAPYSPIRHRSRATQPPILADITSRHFQIKVSQMVRQDLNCRAFKAIKVQYGEEATKLVYILCHMQPVLCRPCAATAHPRVQRNRRDALQHWWRETCPVGHH